MQTKNLSTLKIHKLTQAQYDRELEAGRIDENALYLTPDDGTSGAVVEDSMTSGSAVNAPSIKAVQNAFSNPNLLINSDFRNPVNQRGQKDYNFTGTKIYTIDRWWTTGNVTVSDTCLNFWGQNSYFVQTFEHVLVATKHTITVSVVSMYGTVTCNGVSLKQGLNYITFDATSSNYGTELVFYADGDASINIEFVKLEQGEIATPFVPRLYGEELALCQRYYQHHEIIFARQHGNTFTGGFLLPVEMRVTPSGLPYTLKETATNKTLAGYDALHYTNKAVNYMDIASNVTSENFVTLTMFLDAEIY